MKYFCKVTADKLVVTKISLCTFYVTCKLKLNIQYECERESHRSVQAMSVSSEGHYKHTFKIIDRSDNIKSSYSNFLSVANNTIIVPLAFDETSHG